MHLIRSLLTAFVLVSLLPWCGITAASAQPADVVNVMEDLQGTDGVNAAHVGDASISAPPKTKRLAVLQQMRCSADAPVVSGIDRNPVAPKDLQLPAGNPRLIQRCAPAPPTSPPRHV